MRYILKSLSRSWQKSTITQMSNLVTLSITYGLLVFILNGVFNVDGLLSSWGDDFRVSVYLKSVDKTDRSVVENFLEKIPEVRKVKFLSKEAGAKEISETLSKSFISGIDINEVIPDSLEVTLKPSFVEQANFYKKLENLSTSLLGLKQVDDVSYGKSWIRNYSSFFRFFNKISLWLLLVLGLSGFYVLMNVVKSSILGRRKEIEVLEIVGASKEYIRLPYIIEGGVMSLVAMLVAILVNYGIFDYLRMTLSDNPMFAGLSGRFSFFSIWILLVVFIGSIVFGSLVALLTIRSVNNGWSASTRLNG